LLALVWAALLAYNFGLFGGDKTGGGGGARLKRSRQAAAAKAFPVLMLEKLNMKRPAYKKVRKDIFTPFSQASAMPVVPAMPTGAPLPAAALTDPLARLATELSFIGFIEKNDEKTVFLAKGEDVLLVKEGASIAGVARVLEITDRRMLLGDIYGATGKSFEIGLE